jgi:hypothetical protein
VDGQLGADESLLVLGSWSARQTLGSKVTSRRTLTLREGLRIRPLYCEGMCWPVARTVSLLPAGGRLPIHAAEHTCVRGGAWGRSPASGSIPRGGLVCETWYDVARVLLAALVMALLASGVVRWCVRWDGGGRCMGTGPV